MAFSLPLSETIGQKEHHETVCQLCENDSKLTWKCLDCELKMCQRCKEKVHPKFPSLKEHTVIDIKAIDKHQPNSEPKSDLNGMKCEVHRGQNVCFFCESCERLVCQTCATTSHKKHGFSEINGMYEITLSKLRDERRNIERKLQTLLFNELKLKRTKSTEQSNYDKMKQDIFDYEKDLIYEIRKHVVKFVNELDNKWLAVSNSFERETKRLNEEKRQLLIQQKEINQLLQTHDAKDVFSAAGTFLKPNKESTNLKRCTIKDVPRFIHGDKTKFSIDFGKLEEINLQIYTDLQVKAQYETELKFISSVVSCFDGSVLICDKLSNILQLVEPRDGNLSVLLHTDIEVIDVACHCSGDLFLAVRGSSNLKRIPFGSTDIRDSVYDVSPLYPTAVHVTCDDKVIIGAVDAADIPATGPRQVIVMDQKGYQEEVIQYDIHKQPLFNLPSKISSYRRSIIAVIDILFNDNRGRVVILNQTKGLRNEYFGHRDVNNQNYPFKPLDISATPLDNFVVADLGTHILHILNGEAEIVTLYNTEEIGITQPLSLFFSNEGVLYIGCCTDCYNYKRAKLYEIKCNSL